MKIRIADDSVSYVSDIGDCFARTEVVSLAFFQAHGIIRLLSGQRLTILINSRLLTELEFAHFDLENLWSKLGRIGWSTVAWKRVIPVYLSGARR